MAIKTRYDCVGCETCTGCGAQDPYEVVKCDCCGEEFCAAEKMLETINGLHFCAGCCEWTTAEKIIGEE